VARPGPGDKPAQDERTRTWALAFERPVILTVNGKAAAVVQDAAAYQHLLDLAAEASAAEGIRQGLDDLANGRTRSARKVFDELRTEYGVPR
jgi:PHD/YefM family antitoxin component YafN of YafNO toxin-antitoxin module